MKKICKVLIIASILFESSCAMMFNSKEVEVAINSSPQGAQVYIDGQSYGKTPTTLYIEPKNYQVVLSKPGYGSAQIQLETWQAVRRKQGDGGRCIADILGSMLIIPLYSAIWSVYCRDFKEPEYSAVIPYTGRRSAGLSGSGSMIGSGQNPADMIPYYYGQNQSSGARSQGGQGYNSPVASGPSAYSEFSVNGGPQPPQPMQMPSQSNDEERMQEMRQRMMIDKASKGGVPKSGSMMNMGKDQTDMINYYYQQDMKKLGGVNVEPDYNTNPEDVDDRVRSVTGQPELLYQ